MQQQNLMQNNGDTNQTQTTKTINDNKEQQRNNVIVGLYLSGPHHIVGHVKQQQ